MGRILIGSFLGGLVQFIIGAIAWASPLGRLAFNTADAATTADLQVALARNLTQSGTGTYFVPSPETAEGTVMLGKGPVALIMFNTAGQVPMEAAALIEGLALSIGMMMLLGLALSMIDGAARRFRALLLIATATVLYFVVSLPVFNFYMPWDWWSYLAAECFVAVIAGGWVMLRFMPNNADKALADPTTGLVEQGQEAAGGVEIAPAGGASV
jgi:hypothetical protein